jgi:hypothetical protein
MVEVSISYILAVVPRSLPAQKAENQYLIPMLIVGFGLFFAYGVYSYWRWKKESARKPKP